MANIFAGTEPPAWLTAATRQKPGQLGDIAGLALGGLLNAAERDPNAPNDASFADSRKGVKQGLAEARLNQADPLWQLKVAQTQAATLSRMAQAETMYATAQQKMADTSAWMEDAQTITPWLSARPEDRDEMPVPAVRSKTGASLIERTQSQDSRYFVGKEANRIREDSSKVQLENQKRTLDWANAVGGASADIQSQIAELPDHGWVDDGQGRKIPSTQALSLLNTWRASNDLLPYGAKQSEVKKPNALQVEATKQAGRVDLENVKQGGRLDLDAQKAQEKQDYEATRQENRKELLEDASKYKIDLEKLKNDLKVRGKDGKSIGKDEFVNRHYNTVFNAIVKDSGKPADASKKALQILERSYDTLKPAEPAQTATPPAATGGTNAAPTGAAATSGGNTNLNFDAFEKWKSGQK